ncbi:hypothetical protein BACT_0451 [Bifidobacterium actinocoloniiforme DSM 22766]|uniref:Uncharacterized protein n=1 Tax=Bifidobacterium actinocoloniiforme DSM 22766 TaxID=1437605 RepID=A0A086YZQ1_9BIFI|nr:hypothetical protein [Bifidobacterium actinocoloniiforme]AKV55057.1 hypothetical protein AB656_00880 [Bifidobacterium actinocoloniiforme DSM 22766]KFI39751.1 hypothetical protein BACT_0451 [Bifidobacterium actinocoloniiforme DSM 22766]
MSERDSDRPEFSAGGEDDHLSDEEIERALAGFEQEFQEDAAGGSQASDGPLDGQAGPQEADPLTSGGFDEELEGLIGNKAKAALIVTRLASAELLAAFCQISDISAVCLEDSEGAVAVLRNLDGDGPEAAVKDLTCVISGLSAMLVVNRADKLEAKLWVDGRSGEAFPPPVLFASAAGFVEDLLIGAADVDMLTAQGIKSFDSGDMDQAHAMGVIASHTRFRRGGGPASGRVE